MSVTDLLASLEINDAPEGYLLCVEIDLALRGEPKRDALERWIGPWEEPRREPRRISCRSVARSEYPSPPGEWVDLAACKGHRMFYDALQAHSQRISVEDRKMEKRALLICQSCPVLTECRTWAMQPVDPAIDHVAGGLTPKERRDMRRLGWPPPR